MSEERKPEESLISDETLFFGYAKSIAGGNQAARIREDTAWIADSASKMVNQHRKLFPKKLDKK